MSGGFLITQSNSTITMDDIIINKCKADVRLLLSHCFYKIFNLEGRSFFYGFKTRKKFQDIQFILHEPFWPGKTLDLTHLIPKITKIIRAWASMYTFSVHGTMSLLHVRKSQTCCIEKFQPHILH